VQRICMFVFLSLVLPSAAFSQAPDPSKLTLDRIFASDDFQGERVPQMKWLDGGGYTTFKPSEKIKGGRDLYRFDSGGKSELIVAAEKLIPPNAKEPLAIQGLEFSKDLDVLLIYTNTAKVWRLNTRGDYWTFRRSTGKLAKLGGDAKPSTLMFAKISPDGKQVGYVRENNIYVEPVEGGPAIKLTADGTNEIINGTFDWVYEEEFSCRDGWKWSPDGKQIAYWQMNTHGVKMFTMIDNTNGSYPALTTFPYPKAGERNSSCRVGVVPSVGGTTKWIEVPGDTINDYYIPRMDWVESPQELIIQRVNRLQNSIDVMTADPASGKVRTILSDRDGAWLDLHDDAMDWIEKGTSFTWISERDGWRHLYVQSRDGSTLRRITHGDYDVIKVLHVDEKAGQIYFYASPENPTQHYLYKVALSGSSAPVRLSPADQPGWHDYSISKDGTQAIHTYSSFGKPSRVELVSLPDHKVLRTLATNDKLRETVGKLTPTPMEFFRADIGNGVELDGWMIKPANFDPTKKYPVLFHVYGEPAGQTVTDRWGGGQYFWHMMQAQQGYIVACIDNRGTPCPRGRDFRKVVYRKIGVTASEDQANALKDLLKKRPYMDPKRIGVWGWSGGGSMTLNLLLRYPDLYQTGMSVAPVPDMKLYDTIYQERYMGLPQANTEDYKNGSPISHATNLKGNLLIVHGSGDDNCHYQGTEKLVDKLIEFNKPFTLMAYPNRSHSIHEGKNTTRHLYALLTRYLNENLPVGPKP
jgi:dipeptidyl-peptidase 4